MIHIYYHIYAIEGADAIVKEQLSLIKANFKFPYKLNIGISIADDDTSISNILSLFNTSDLKDVRAKGNEFVTLELIEKDKEKFGDSDYILYLHTKGASKQSQSNYQNIVSWRHLMNYFNIERCESVFKIFEKTSYNTYGVLLGQAGNWKIYSGNFWWARASYIKTIEMAGVRRNRFNAEVGYIQNGIDWKPYSSYNREGENHYLINFNELDYKQ
jgi:hypothetical protein